MLIVVIAALLGIWRYRSVEYFKWVGATFVWLIAANLLFSGGGTLDAPSGDGIITRQLRIATEDGPMMGLLAIVLLVLIWGTVIYFISRMVKAAKAVSEADELAMVEDTYSSGADTTRKSLETVGLFLAAAIWIWFAFVRPAQAEAQVWEAATQNAEQQEPEVTALTIEQEVLGAASEINASTPQQIDPTTTLLRATASERTLTYHYRLEPTGSDRESLMSFLRANVVPKACTGELRPHMRESDVSYAFSYTGSDFADPVRITIDENLCSSLEG